MLCVWFVIYREPVGDAWQLGLFKFLSLVVMIPDCELPFFSLTLVY